MDRICKNKPGMSKIEYLGHEQGAAVMIETDFKQRVQQAMSSRVGMKHELVDELSTKQDLPAMQSCCRAEIQDFDPRDQFRIRPNSLCLPGSANSVSRSDELQ